MSAHRQAAAAQALLLLRLGAELAITRLYALLFHGKWTIDLHVRKQMQLLVVGVCNTGGEKSIKCVCRRQQQKWVKFMQIHCAALFGRNCR